MSRDTDYLDSSDLPEGADPLMLRMALDAAAAELRAIAEALHLAVPDNDGPLSADVAEVIRQRDNYLAALIKGTTERIDSTHQQYLAALATRREIMRYQLRTATQRGVAATWGISVQALRFSLGMDGKKAKDTT